MFGEAAKEKAGVSSPYEPFCDGWVAFIVDLEASVIHQPGPCPLDDPSFRESFETAGMDLVHDLGGDVPGCERDPEHLFEPAVAEYLLEPGGLGQRFEEAGRSADVVTGRGGHHYHGQQQSEGIDDPEALASRDLLPGVVTPTGAGNCGSSPDAAGIDDSRRGLRFAAFLGSNHLSQPVHDALPGAVSAPGHVVAMHSVPVRVTRRQRPPLAPGGGHVQDGVDDRAPVVLEGPSYLPVSGEYRDQIAYKVPLSVGQIAVNGAPGSAI